MGVIVHCCAVVEVELGDLSREGGRGGIGLAGDVDVDVDVDVEGGEDGRPPTPSWADDAASVLWLLLLRQAQLGTAS